MKCRFCGCSLTGTEEQEGICFDCTEEKEEPVKATDQEQWLSAGDCSICRRQKYCKKACKAHKQKIERQLRQAVSSSVVRAFMNGK